jgi:hypothetical protein
MFPKRSLRSILTHGSALSAPLTLSLKVHLNTERQDIWQIRPGFLLEPLGWVQDRLSQAIEVEPRLVELLFNLDHAKMHTAG